MEESGSLPLYEYLFQCIRKDIQDGVLKDNERMPSRRKLAQHLSVSVSTVEAAYAQLLSAGYLYSKDRSGYYVSPGNGTGRYVPEFFACEIPERDSPIDFKANKCSMKLFPMNTWARLMRQVLSTQEPALYETVPFGGLYVLRRAIAVYLYENKGMRVSPSQILVGAGTEFLYGRLLQLLAAEAGSEYKRKGEPLLLALEEPGYRKFAHIAESDGLSCVFIPMDRNGLRTDLLEESDASLAHVSPANEFPTGIVMTMERRQELLAWCREKRGRWIIEDDYDSELRFEGKPLPTLFAMDTDRQHVIYMNTFSKTMVPSLRISYLVLPDRLMEVYRERLNFYSCSVSGFEQSVLAKFISEGYFERHISKLKRFYKKRKALVLQALTASPLGRIVKVRDCKVGTHLLLEIKTNLTDREIHEAAKARGIELALLSDYCADQAEGTRGVLVLNFANLDESNIGTAMRLLEDIFQKDISQTELLQKDMIQKDMIQKDIIQKDTLQKDTLQKDALQKSALQKSAF